MCPKRFRKSGANAYSCELYYMKSIDEYCVEYSDLVLTIGDRGTIINDKFYTLICT